MVTHGGLPVQAILALPCHAMPRRGGSVYQFPAASKATPRREFRNARIGLIPKIGDVPTGPV